MLSYMKNYFIVLHAIILIANNKERGILLIFIHVTTNCIGKTPDSMVAS